MLKVAAFIDGSNLYAGAKAIGLDIDYFKVLAMLRKHGDLVRAFYYTALLPENGPDPEYSPLRPLIDWLDYNGFTVITKAAKEFTDSTGRRKVKGNMDIEIAVDMLEMADRVDHIFLFSGDGDFRHLVEAVQRKGVRVTVISTMKGGPSPMIADELRRQADDFIDLATIADNIKKQPKGDTHEKPLITSSRNTVADRLRDDKRAVPG